MYTQKTRILGIAPYAGLKNLMDQLAMQRDDIELVTYIGDLKTGAEIASSHLSESFDVILSRGGTAELIRQISDIPVIDISLSPFDILRAIKLAENYASDYAIVGFSGITSAARVLCDLLQYSIDIITLQKEEDVSGILEALKAKGCRVVLCDMITCTTAKQIGLNPILIISGTESIQSAFDQAVDFCNSYHSLRQKNQILTKTLQNKGENTVILAADTTVLFSFFTTENNSMIIDYLKKLICSTPKISFTKSFHSIGNCLYAITLHMININDSDYFIFSVYPNPIPPASTKYGLQFSDYESRKNKYFNSFYALTTAAEKIMAEINHLNNTSLPVMILEEEGSGSEHVATRLYTDSTAWRNPFISIDCSLIDEKTWNFLVQHYNSPFCDNGNTLFLSNIQRLTSEKRQLLLSLILDTNLHKRNRLLLSCSSSAGREDHEAAKDFIKNLSCATLVLPPLRQSRENLAFSAGLYLNTLNVTLSRQIIGFDQNAFDLLFAYDWPQNFSQMERVLTESALHTTTSYIKEDTVKYILSKEKLLFTPAEAADGSSFDINRSLNDIIKEVIHLTLKQCNGNQSKAAKRLGIGRTTLWRYLNQDI